MHSKFHRTLLLIGALVLSAGTVTAQSASAAAKKAKSPKHQMRDYAPGKEPYNIDIGFTFVEQFTEFNNMGRTNWIKGGSGDISFNFFHGFGLAGNITGEHAPNVAPSFPEDSNYGAFVANLGRFSYGVGPRYTFDGSKIFHRLSRGHNVRIFGQFLIGETHSFDTYIPYIESHRDNEPLPGPNCTGPNCRGPVPPGIYNYDTINTCVSQEGGGGIDVNLWKNMSLRVIQGSWIRTHMPDGRFNRQEDVRLGAGIAFHFRPKY
ncbi:MAG: hypothetical protein JSS87_07465 [Acidobacteria bacterium]|nr:hypothetical protein [Acidobacteriota bacterium]